MTDNVTERQVSMVHFCFLAIIVGIVTGIGALIFHLLIAGIHNIFFLGKLSFHYDGNILYGPSPWGPFIILAPVIGGLAVVWMVKKYAPEAKGHGVPEVMYSVYYKEGIMRPIVALIKSLSSAVSIGSGASVGKEGPIIQIGASLGSTVGQVFHLVPWQRTTLLAAGAGAGIAATFNTPLGGVMFAVEIMMLEISSRTFLPVVLATGTATYIGRIFFGLQPAFIVPIANMPSVDPLGLPQLLAFLALGGFCGIMSWLYIDTLTFMDKTFNKIKTNDYIRHTIGMLIVGTMMYILSVNFGHYYIDGVGYGTIQEILQGNITAIGFLLLLFILKLLATTISLGSGSSGGVFSPALFLGACIGAFFGGAVGLMFPGIEFNIVEFAIVGMAAVLGGTTGAAITAIIMIFEMTRDYNIIVPVIVAVALAIGVRQILREADIYTIKLIWRGLRVPDKRHINMFLVRHAKDVMETSYITMPEDMRLDEMLNKLKSQGEEKTHVLVTDNEKLIGTVPITHVMRAAGGVTSKVNLGDVMIKTQIKVEEDDIFHDIMKRLRQKKSSNIAIVVKDKNKPMKTDNIIGVISKDRIIDYILRYFG